MPWNDWWGMHGFGMLMGPIMFIVFIVIAILIVVPLIRWMGLGPPWQPHNAPQFPSRTALDILSERYARGEIDKAEYEEKRRVISQG